MNRRYSVILEALYKKVFQSTNQNKSVKTGSDDAAFIMSNANNVIIVPGYGMAVAQAQHALREMYKKIVVKYAIHPVAEGCPDT